MNRRTIRRTISVKRTVSVRVVSRPVRIRIVRKLK